MRQALSGNGGLTVVPGSTSIGLVSICVATGVFCLAAASCSSHPPEVDASIEFTHLPPAGDGTPNVIQSIAGRVQGARPGQRIVLFARSGMWWVQPLANKPYTPIQKDFTWKGSTHPGTAYAALLVDPDYRPPSTVNVLPQKGGPIQAVARAEGGTLAHGEAQTLSFSGYEWLVRKSPGNPAGTPTRYDPANAWVDAAGLLHLRIARSSPGWTCAQVGLARSLGYGSYRFVVRDVSHLEPSAVLTISAWDGSAAYREMDIEISRWGEASGKNAQYVVQPYYVPANVVRFLSPAGRLTYSFDWEPGRVEFRTIRGSAMQGKPDVVAGHVFTSGVPSAGSETIQLNFYAFGNPRIRLEHEAEVIIEKFEYLP